MKLKRFGEIALDVGVAALAYYLLHWIGFALWVFYVISGYAYQILICQNTMQNTLLSRLPDRCKMCHREIVDQAGVFDHDGIYHETCADKLDSLEELRMEAGVPCSEAIHKPRARTAKT